MFLFSIIDDSPTHTFLDVSYDLRAQSDPLRVTKNNRVLGIIGDPVSETNMALIMSDSRVLLWETKTIDYQVSGTCSYCIHVAHSRFDLINQPI